MATPKTTRRKSSGPKPVRQFPWVSALVLVLVAGAAVWWFFGAAIGGYTAVGTAYGAKNACSCRHISGRELGSCEDDFVPGMAMVFLTEDEDEKSVTATVPLLASTTARYREGYGCVLEGVE